MVENLVCELCGAEAKHPVSKIINGRELNFCCNGCLQVYELSMDDDQPSPPTPVPNRSGIETGPTKTLVLKIGGMSCANCVAHVDRSLRSVEGVTNVSVDLPSEIAKVEVDPNSGTIEELKQAVKAAGYEMLGVIDEVA